MGLIPHPEIPVGEIRITDLLLLLAGGALWELVTRLAVRSVQRKSGSLKDREAKLLALRYETDRKRKLGPPAFVETSKLERLVLSEEKALEEVYANRKVKVATVQRAQRNVNYAVIAIIFAVFYGIPIIQLEGSKLPDSERLILSRDEAHALASTWNKAFMFPISYVGMGMKLSRWGMENPQSSIGALVVFWSAQVTVGKILDGIEALL